MGSSVECQNEQLSESEMYSLYMIVHLHTLHNFPPVSWALNKEWWYQAFIHQNCILYRTISVFSEKIIPFSKYQYFDLNFFIVQISELFLMERSNHWSSCSFKLFMIQRSAFSFQFFFNSIWYGVPHQLPGEQPNHISISFFLHLKLEMSIMSAISFKFFMIQWSAFSFQFFLQIIFEMAFHISCPGNSQITDHHFHPSSSWF